MQCARLSTSSVVSGGLTSKSSLWNTRNRKDEWRESRNIVAQLGSKRDISRHCKILSSKRKFLLSSSPARHRKGSSIWGGNQLSSDYGINSSCLDGTSVLEEDDLSSRSETSIELKENFSDPPDFDSVKRELARLSLPAFAGQALEPLAQLMETAYIGRLGPVQLASAAVSMSIFNIISKLFNMPLLSVATSFVAEEISNNERRILSSDEGSLKKSSNGKPVIRPTVRLHLSSVSSALLLATAIGVFEAIALSLGSGLFLTWMGIPPDSPMRWQAQRFLSLRALGAPALVVSLALHGVFRGLKDTKTPLFCLGIGNFSAIFLFPTLMYYFQLGVSGAAIASVISQYIVSILMIWHLNKRAVILPPNLRELKFGGYMKSGGFLIGRTLAVLITITTAASMAARQGPIAMAAHQICLQVWLSVSLLTDAPAASGQVLVASYLSKGDYQTVKKLTKFLLKIGLVTGASLTAILGVSFGSIATLFTQDAEVLGVVKTGILFVSASQPMNALAFIYDGLQYGVSDFSYSATSMMTVGAISTAFLLYASPIFGIQGVWAGLALFMGLRAVAGILRLIPKNGPWWFLHDDLKRFEVPGPKQVKQHV